VQKADKAPIVSAKQEDICALDFRAKGGEGAMASWYNEGRERACRGRGSPYKRGTNLARTKEKEVDITGQLRRLTVGRKDGEHGTSSEIQKENQLSDTLRQKRTPGPREKRWEGRKRIRSVRERNRLRNYVLPTTGPEEKGEST